MGEKICIIYVIQKGKKTPEDRTEKDTLLNKSAGRNLKDWFTSLFELSRELEELLARKIGKFSESKN